MFRPINVRALLASLPRSPCRPEEVSPGNWVGFDCSPPSYVRRAVRFTQPPGRVGFSPFGTGDTGAPIGAGGPVGSGGTGEALPATVDHRADNMEGPVKNQGATGTCTALSLSTAMEHALRRLGQTEPVSSMHLWSQYRVPRMGDAGDSNIDKRTAATAVWPYDPAEACKMMRRSYDSCGPAYGVESNTGDDDPQIAAHKQKADGAGRYELVAVERLPEHDPVQFAAVIAGGDDLWVAFNVNRQAWRNSGMRNHVIPDYSIAEPTGHAVVLCGYRTVNGIKQFLIHNSWGPTWGDNGYAWISENMVRDQLRSAYRVRVGDPASPSPPGGGGQSCPAGQAWDAVYGQCVPACPDGTVPAAGLCLPPVPGMPGSSPGPSPQPAPAPSGGGCPQGQAQDVMTGQCMPLCPGGLPAVGGMCLPIQ